MFDGSFGDLESFVPNKCWVEPREKCWQETQSKFEVVTKKVTADADVTKVKFNDLETWKDFGQELPISLSHFSKIVKSVQTKLSQISIKESSTFATEGSKETTMEGSNMTATEESNVTAMEGSRISAMEESKVTAMEGSRISAMEESKVTAVEGSKVRVI